MAWTLDDQKVAMGNMRAALMDVHLADCWACATAGMMAVRWVAPMVAPMAEHWVAVMVVLKDATWAVCSVDVTGVPLVVAKGALSVGH